MAPTKAGTKKKASGVRAKPSRSAPVSSSSEQRSKQLPVRLSVPNWQRAQIARIQSDISMQKLLASAVDEWLRKRGYEGLDMENDGQ